MTENNPPPFTGEVAAKPTEGASATSPIIAVFPSRSQAFTN